MIKKKKKRNRKKFTYLWQNLNLSSIHPHQVLWHSKVVFESIRKSTFLFTRSLGLIGKWPCFDIMLQLQTTVKNCIGLWIMLILIWHSCGNTSRQTPLAPLYFRGRQFKKAVQLKTVFNKFWSKGNWSTKDLSCGLNLELHSGLEPQKCNQSVLLQI